MYDDPADCVTDGLLAAAIPLRRTPKPEATQMPLFVDERDRERYLGRFAPTRLPADPREWPDHAADALREMEGWK